MKRKIITSLSVILVVLGMIIVKESNLTLTKLIIDKVDVKTANVLTTGEYISPDGKKLVINEDATATYQGAYSLTVTQADTGHSITGSVGTNNIAVTFYQLSESCYVSNTMISYTHNGVTEYLDDYTVFTNSTSSQEEGNIEVWTNGVKKAGYKTFQAAVDAADENSIIKITSNMTITSGAYINKNITIDGLNNTLDKSSWTNPLFVVEKEKTVSIKNIIIDGGSTGFKVDYDAVTFKNFKIPLVSGSAANDIKQNTAAILSKGDLTVNNTAINNVYTASKGSAIHTAAGNLSINNSSFTHNRASSGGAVAVGANLQSGETTYPVDNLYITNSTFSENYSSNGGGLYVYNLTNFSIENSKFLNNTVNDGYGGAFMIQKQSTVAEKRNMPYVQGRINNSIFDGNWVGNDGAAIQNYDAEISTTNTIFSNNVGVHPTSSVATFSQQVDRATWATEYMSNCQFIANVGDVSGLADHGGHMYFTVEDTTFTKNNGSQTCYFLTSVIHFKRCSFTNENVQTAVVMGAGYSIASEFTGTAYSGPTLIVEDTTFENNSAVDIFIKQRNYDTKYNYLEYSMEVRGNVAANVEMWDSSNLTVSGNLTGDIATDAKTTTDDITINEGGAITGEIITTSSDAVRVILRYPSDSNLFGYTQKILYLENGKTYTPAEIFELSPVTNDGKTQKIYTDQALTSEWNYTPTANITVYVAWEEHTHTYDKKLGAVNNIIGYQCECGQIDETRILGLRIPPNTTYDGKKKAAIIDNSLNVSSSDYKLEYFVSDQKGGWTELSTEPISLGYYKAKLTYNGLSSEITFSIVEKNENPNTDSNIVLLIEIIILGIVCLLSIKLISKKFKNI